MTRLICFASVMYFKIKFFLKIDYHKNSNFPFAAGLVLIRRLKLIELLEANLGGPGILCKRLNITKEHNKQDLTISHKFCVYESHLKPDYICTLRIGISKDQEKFWRFKIF